jgi:hypothetical protein
MEPAKARRDPPWIAAWTFFVCVMVAYSCVILSARNPPPFVDYPDWVYQGVLFHGVLTGHPVAGYMLKHYPVPNSTTTVGLGVLDCVMPWQWAGKLWIVLYLALAGFASWMVLQALGIREWRLVVTIPAIVFLNLNFWYGHINFEIGLCLVLLLLGMLVRKASSLGVAAMLVLIFFTHMEACAAALLLLGIWSAAARQWRRLWATLPAIVLTVWYAAARFASGDADVRGLPPADYRYGSPAFLVYKVNTFFKTFGYINASTMRGLSESEQMLGRGVFVLLIGASLVIAALCLIMIVRAAVKANAMPRGDEPRRTIAGFALMLLIVSLLLPQIFLGVADPGSRLLLLAAAAGLLIVDWRGRAGLAIACLSALFCVVNLWQLAHVERNPAMAGHVRDLPAAMVKYAHVEPSTRVQYYEHLERGETNEAIFPTGMFVQVAK